MSRWMKLGVLLWNLLLILPAHAQTLDQPWDFYWQRFIEPTQLAEVPDYQVKADFGWKALPDKKNGGQLGPAGYGTYRYELRGLKPHKDGYQILFPFLSTASRILVFNKDKPESLVEARTGVIGTSEDSMVPQIREVTLHFQPESVGETWVVLVQISNFYHSSGGILTTPGLAPGYLLSERTHKDQLGYIFSIGVILVICIYNIMIFVRRREDRSSLMLALFCLVAALRTFANGNLGNLFFSADRAWPFLFKYVLEYGTLALEPLTYAAFIHLSFRRASWPKILPIFCAISGVGLLATFITLPITYGRFLGLYQLNIIVQAVFTLIVMARAVRLQQEGAKLALSSGLVLVFTITYDILVSYNVMPQPYIMQYGIDVFVFLQSQVVARRFATAFRTAERLQNELQIEVERQTQDIRTLMEHVPQGIFLVLDNMTIQPDYSRHLEDILGHKNLGGQAVTGLLFEGQCITLEQKSIIETVMLSAFGSDLYAWEVNSWQLPRELTFVRRDGQKLTLEMDWNPVLGKAGTVDRILITIRDVTSMRALQAENQHRQAELDCLIELLATAPGTLPRFFEQARIHLEKSRQKLASNESSDQIKRLVFIELHSLKGLARSQGLRRLTTAVHEAEQHYTQAQKFDRVKLQDDLAELRKILDGYQAIYKQKISRDANQGAELHLERDHLFMLESKLNPLRQERSLDGPARELMFAVQDFLSVYLYRSAQNVFDELMQEVERLAQDLGKEKPKVSLIGLESLMLLPETERMVRSSFLHVVRNSLDHGIEDGAERTMKGKPPQGHIMLVVREVDGRFEIAYEDDGRGVDLARIEKTARDRGLWKLERRMTPAEATETLFQSGFSTKDAVSDISGRGVGLDAVRSYYRELGGDVYFNLDGVEDESDLRLPFRLMGYLPKTVALHTSLGAPKKAS